MRVSLRRYVLVGLVIVGAVGCGDSQRAAVGQAPEIAGIESSVTPGKVKLVQIARADVAPQRWPSAEIAQLEPEYTASVDRRGDFSAEAIGSLLDQALEQDTDMLIRLEPGATREQLEAIRGLEVTDELGFGTGGYRVSFDRARRAEVAQALSGLAAADVVAVNEILETSRTSNDPFLSAQFGLRNNEARVHAAWDVNTDGTGVIVAVIDGKVETTHPDLRANCMAPVDLTFGTVRGHGTHVAGIIGAVGNNGVGVAGVCWRANILPITVMADNDGDGQEEGSTFTILNGIYQAVARGAKVINMSLGGGAPNQFTFNALNYARGQGVLVICAAGNAANNNDARPTYPAGYELDNIVSVAAVGRRDALASFSNYGRTSVDIAAPGYRIASTFMNGRYVYQNGTSMAAPMVAGAAALIWSRYPGMSYAQVRDRILDSARPVSGLRNRVATGGVLDAAAAIGR